MVAGMEALAAMSGFRVEGDWENLSSSNKSYVLLSSPDRLEAANRQLASLYEKHLPDEQKRSFRPWELRPLTDLNLWIWEATGIPVIGSIQLLGLLILIIACINYINLATAQLLQRTREVGLRKTLGANRAQLFVQFVSESVVLALLALLIALGVLGQVIPLLNDVAGKAMTLEALASPSGILSLLALAAGVGLIAGSYPAWLVGSGRIVGMLQGEFQRGRKGSWVRSIMLVAQFTISVFMMIAVAIVYAQNQKVAEGGQIFAQDQILVLSRVNRPEIRDRLEPLRNELLRTPGVEGFALSSQVPFEQNHSQQLYSTTPGDEAAGAEIYNIQIDEAFTSVYDMPVIAGRELSRDFAQDILQPEDSDGSASTGINVLVNESAARRLGFDTPADALEQSFWSLDLEERPLEYRVVGVVSDNNFLGLFNGVKPMIFYNEARYFRLASVRIAGGDIPDTVARIESVWADQVPEYPIQQRFLSDVFNDIFNLLTGINAALSAFAALALLVALIGLFGLTAFIAEQRTKEIGIRKVMGANVPRIVRLLVWQFLRPVFVAIVIAAPLAWLAAQAYVNFFVERIGMSPFIFISAGFAAVAVAALTTSIHAVRAARARPVMALRYE